MILLRSLLACSLTLALLAPVAEGAKAKKKKGNHPTAGEVTAIALEKDKTDEGTMTVKVHVHKKKKAAAAVPATEPTEKKFTITKETKFVKVTGRKKDKTETATTMAEVKVGTRVMVVASLDGKAEKVLIHEGKKGKKKKNQS